MATDKRLLNKITGVKLRQILPRIVGAAPCRRHLCSATNARIMIESCHCIAYFAFVAKILFFIGYVENTLVHITLKNKTLK